MTANVGGCVSVILYIIAIEKLWLESYQASFN